MKLTSLRRTLCSTGLTVALIAAVTVAQSPLQTFQRAVLRGDTAAARAALRTVQPLDTATRAVLQAAMLDIPDRAMAMEQLVQVFPNHPVADTALVAGCAALLATEWDEYVPGVYGPYLGGGWPKGFDSEKLIRGFRSALAVRQRAGGDPVSLADATWMLGMLSIQGVADNTRNVSAGSTIPVPSPLSEAMQLRFHPWDLDRPLREIWLQPQGRPIDGGRLRAGRYGQKVPAPPPGVYVMELTARTGGWTRLELLVVSDLTLVTQTWPGRLAVMASLDPLDGKARAADRVPLELVVRTEAGKTTTLHARTDDQGLASFALPGGRLEKLSLSGRRGAHVVRILPPTPETDFEVRKPSFRAHLMTDRPLYRPGETVEGRVLLRHLDLETLPTTTGAQSRIFVARKPRDRQVEIQLWPGSQEEVVLRGRTDSDGVLPFSVPLPTTTRLGEVPVQIVLPNGEADATIIEAENPFTIEEFRRPVILPSLTGPKTCDRREPWVVTLRCKFASGAPAAGLTADVTAECEGLTHRQAVRLGADGTARVPIHVHELPLPDRSLVVKVTAEFASPDGQRPTEELTATVPARFRPPSTVAADQLFRITEVSQNPRAGEPLILDVVGTPGERVLLTTVRDVPIASRAIQLDSKGAARVTLATRVEDFPGLQVVASLHSRRPEAPSLDGHDGGTWSNEQTGYDWPDNLSRHTFALAAPGAALQVNLAHDPVYRPGATAAMQVRVTRAGQPVAANVAITIVDETLYALNAERTAHPNATLQPQWSELVTALVGGSSRHTPPFQILGRMLLRSGHEPPGLRTGGESSRGGHAWLDDAGSGDDAGGSATMRRRSRVATRRVFRPTALFVANLRTGEDGIARFTCTLPEDLTDWRITAVACNDTFYGAKITAKTTTRLPVAVTTVLPRVLRQGDTLAVDVITNQQDRATTGGSVQLTVSGEPARIEGVRDQAITVAGRQPTRSSFRLRGIQAGTAKVTATATLGTVGADRAELQLPVLPDLVVLPVVATTVIRGKGSLELPKKPGLGPRRTVRILGNQDALLRDAAAFLDGYPYGCVEQVLSKLTPLFVAARATRLAHGGTAPKLTEPQGLRLEAGMIALRAHLIGRDRGFRWWHGETIDQRMTALALHALILAREAGIDPERFGIGIDADSPLLMARAEAIVTSRGLLAAAADSTGTTADVRDAELVIALLRYAPQVKIHRQAVQLLLQHKQPRTAGMLARIGLALHEAGDKAGARNALTRILAADRLAAAAGGPGTGFPMDQDGARTAHLLELILRLDPKHLARAQTVGRLLALHHNGRFGSTYSTAAAVNALALDAERTGRQPNPKPFAVTVTAAGRPQTHTLSAANGYTVQCEVVTDGPVQIAVGDLHEVHATLRGGIASAGSTHAGWHEPIRVRRQLFEVVDDAAGKKGRRAVAFEAVPHGRILELELTLSAVEPAAYLVIDCPLPAGFEVLGRPAGVEVRDDRLVRLVRTLRPWRPATFTVRLLAAHKGRVVWPPAVAQAMYAPEISGASAGAILSVTQPKPVPRAGAGATPAPSPMLTKVVLDRKLAAALRAVRTAPTEDVESKLRELRDLFDGVGAQALLALVPELMRRHLDDGDALQVLHGVVADLPAARLAHRKTLHGQPDALGVLMLLHGRTETDADTVSALVRALTADRFAGFDRDQRRRLLLPAMQGLVFEPWDALVRRSATRDGVVHADSTEAAAELQAWVEVLEAAIAMVTSQPQYGSDKAYTADDSLGPIEYGYWHGAKANVNLQFANRQNQRLRWLLLQPWVDKPNLGRLEWVSHLNEVKDRRLVRATYVKLFAAAMKADHVGALRLLLSRVPNDLRSSLRPQHMAALGHAHAEVRFDACNSMPSNFLQSLPEAVLRSAMVGSGGNLSCLRALGSRGVQLVKRWAIEGQRFLERAPTCQFLGLAGLSDLPLPALQTLAEPDTIGTLTKVLAARDLPVAALQLSLKQSDDGPWRICLVEELARRGAHGLSIAVDDPLRSHYLRILAARRGEATAVRHITEQLLADAEADRSRSRRKNALPAYQRRALVRAIADHIPPELYLRWHDNLAKPIRRQVLQRFAQKEWRTLLAQARVRIPDLLDQIPKKLAAALVPDLLELAERVPGAREAALQRLLQATKDPATLRELALSKQKPPALRLALAKVVFRFDGLPVLYLAAGDEVRTWQRTDGASVAARIRTRGFPGKWSEQEQEQLEILLRRRGLGVRLE